MYATIGVIMELRDYLHINRIKQVDFANMLGCTKTTLSHIVNEKKKPGRYLAIAINYLTSGDVTFGIDVEPLKKANKKTDCSQNEAQHEGTHNSVEKRIIQ